jgi:sterol desaturase/sphingolipid hydroxylase (fatty acid hydroxylase superfamily)
VYLLVLDLAEYLYHRLQHRTESWWALHSVHHSQRQLSFWADDRNHVLDGLLREAFLATVALVIGVPGTQFALIVFATRLVESLSHANVRLSFGWLGERLLVSPRYHRIHHGVGIGHEGPARGCNFATLFPLWDILFRTASFAPIFPPTGIRDDRVVDYGTGFVDQQLKGLARLVHVWIPRGGLKEAGSPS